MIVLIGDILHLFEGWESPVVLVSEGLPGP